MDILKNLIAEKKVIAIIGTGVSIQTTKNNPIASWKGLLLDGLKYCKEHKRNLNEKLYYGFIETAASNELSDLLSVADFITEQLGGPDGFHYKAWLAKSVGGLKVINPNLINCLHNLEIPIFTTNYDGLIESHTGLGIVDWTQGDRIQEVLQGTRKAVVHLHGYWDRHESVVFGRRSYDAVKRDKFIQTVLRGLLIDRMLLFIGFGAGMEDPNFSKYMHWMISVLPKSARPHIRLVKQSECNDPTMKPAMDKIELVPYGQNYSDLADFLLKLGSTTKTVNSDPDMNGFPWLVNIPINDVKTPTSRRIKLKVASELSLVAAENIETLHYKYPCIFHEVFKKIISKHYLNVSSIERGSGVDLFVFYESRQNGKKTKVGHIFRVNGSFTEETGWGHHNYIVKTGRDADSHFFKNVNVFNTSQSDTQILHLGSLEASNIILLNEYLNNIQSVIKNNNFKELIKSVFTSIEQIRKIIPVEINGDHEISYYYPSLFADFKSIVLDVTERPNELILENNNKLSEFIPPGQIPLIRRGQDVFLRWEKYQHQEQYLCLLKIDDYEKRKILWKLVEKNSTVSVKLDKDNKKKNTRKKETTSFTFRELVKKLINLISRSTDQYEGENFKKSELKSEAERILRHLKKQKVTWPIGIVHGNLRSEGILLLQASPKEPAFSNFKFLDYAFFENEAPIIKDHASLEVSVWVDLLSPCIEKFSSILSLFYHITGVSSILHFENNLSKNIEKKSLYSVAALIIKVIRKHSWELLKKHNYADHWWHIYNKVLYYEFVSRLNNSTAMNGSNLKKKTIDHVLTISLLLALIAAILDEEEGK